MCRGAGRYVCVGEQGGMYKEVMCYYTRMIQVS